jgi:hypothetical protein
VSLYCRGRRRRRADPGAFHRHGNAPNGGACRDRSSLCCRTASAPRTAPPGHRGGENAGHLAPLPVAVSILALGAYLVRALIFACCCEDHLRRGVRERRSLERAVQFRDLEAGTRQQVFNLKPEEIAHGEGLHHTVAIEIVN